MKRIKIKTRKGNEYTGDWNEKFYEYKEKNTYRIYLNNVEGEEDGTCYLVTEEEKERIITESTNNKIEEDNMRIARIKQEFEKLDNEAKKQLIKYFEFTMNF